MGSSASDWEQRSFECLQVEDWIEAIRWTTAQSLDLIVTELTSAVLKGDKVFELVSRAASWAIPPPVIALASEVIKFEPTEEFPKIARIAPLPRSLGKSDLACAIETAFSESELGGRHCDGIAQWQFLSDRRHSQAPDEHRSRQRWLVVRIIAGCAGGSSQRDRR
jgi:hypothetical protein